MNVKKLLTTSALVLTMAFSGVAYAEGDWHGKDGHDGHPAWAEVLPKDKAEQFHETMKQAHQKNLVLHDQLHKLHEEMHAILTAPKFDKEAFLAKSEEVTKFKETLHDKTRANMKEAFATAVSNLSQEERQALAAAIEEHRKNGHHHHQWGDEEHNEGMHGDGHGPEHMHHVHHDGEKHSGGPGAGSPPDEQ